MNNKKALVVGATGIIGSYIFKQIRSLNDWEIIGTARHIPQENSEKYVSIDLLDPRSIQENQAALKDVTHIFYAAYQDFPYYSKERIEINTSMLVNIVTAVEQNSPKLKRIVMMQGGGVYGAYLGKFKTPAKEEDARHLPPNFIIIKKTF